MVKSRPGLLDVQLVGGAAFQDRLPGKGP